MKAAMKINQAVANETEAEVIALADGATVRIHGDCAEVTDPTGHLLVRYEHGTVEVTALSGDLTLAAPQGRVAVRSGLDIEFSAARSIRQHAGRSVELDVGSTSSPSHLRLDTGKTTLETKRLELTAKESYVTTAEATVVAGQIATTAARLVQRVERFELTATRLIEKTRDVFRDASDLSQTRVGRVRTIVKGLYSLYSKQTAMVSEEDTSIDGSKVLLG